MKVQFIGATHEVTGSCTLLEVNGRYYLVDCGMEQGEDIFQNVPLPVPANAIEAVFLTHAHIDHSGMLPKLCKDGFRGQIYATEATCNLCRIMLMDSAHIQESEAQWRTRKAERAGERAVEPVYDTNDAAAALRLLRPCQYNAAVQAAEGIIIRMTDIGHLLGSAAIEMWLTEGQQTRKIVFSGDVGNVNQPLLRDPQPVAETEYLVIESTYGDRLQPKERGAIFDRLFSYKFPALLIARDIPPHAECLQMAQKHNVTVLRTKEATSTIVSTIITYLKAALAPRITRHGVLVEVYGEGILLIGDSGIGKSEAAVELLKRGHRLIADDAVEIRKVSTNSLVGTAPKLIRNYIELRGIGIINVAKLFGMGAVRTENEINLIVNIVPWNTQEVYDRLGLEEQYMELLGVKVPMNTIPITPGRNLAMILEVAAMNNRQKKLGYNAALEFTEQVNQHFDENMGKNG